MTLVAVARTLDCIKMRLALSWLAYREAVSDRLESLGDCLVKDD